MSPKQPFFGIDFVSLRLTLYPYCLTGLSDNFTPPITVISGIRVILIQLQDSEHFHGKCRESVLSMSFDPKNSWGEIGSLDSSPSNL